MRLRFLFFCAFLLPCAHAQTGVAVPELAVFDRLMPDMLARWNIRGASLAIEKDGRLVFARGYGMADVEAGLPVEPESLFRISSVSKSLTAAGVMKLVEEGRLDLDAPAFRLLDHLQPPWGAVPDPRLYQITVRQLLHHTGGFDQDKGGVTAGNDPMRPPMSETAATVLGAPHPASAETIIRWMMGRPLDFDPGTRYAYSSFGYCVLGRIIEKVTGLTYGQYIQHAILGPAGITRTRLGRTRFSERAPGEVRYYNYPSMPISTSVFGEGQVLFPYGAYSIEATDANGGWISSAMDLARFGSALDGTRKPALLKPETMRQVLVPPPPPASSNYGLGWFFGIKIPGYRWHFGGTPYTASSYLGCLPGGLCLAVLYNGNEHGSFWTEMESLLISVAANITDWPTHDLSARYYAQDAPAFSRVVNAASQEPGPVAPGEIVTIAGERLGPSRLTAAGTGTRMLFDGAEAPVLFASANFVTAIVPDIVAGRPSTTVAVEYQGVLSPPLRLDVAPAAPGLFPFAVNADQSLNAESRPAASGETITLYGTGEGQTDGQTPPRPLLRVEATIGGEPAEVVYAGGVPGMIAGFLQLILRIPPGVASGAAVPVILRVGEASSPPLHIAIRPAGHSVLEQHTANGNGESLELRIAGLDEN